MTSKQEHIADTLDLLCAIVPGSAGLGLASIRVSLNYTAPELLDTFRMRIHTVLRRGAQNNPVWADEARDIWNKAAKTYPFD